MIERSGIEVYWGYRVCDSNLSLDQIIDRGIFDLIIMTSRYGRPLTDTIEEIKESWKRAHSVLIAFGSPKEGLRKILEREGFKIGEFKRLIVNTIPLQGTETVRTEEALHSTLAILNVIL